MSYPGPPGQLRCVHMELRRIPSGALAGAVAAAIWAAQQPLDKKVFGSEYDDVELLGNLVARDSSAQAAGLAMHMANGAAFGAVYTLVRPLIPGPAQTAGLAAGSAPESRGRRSGPMDEVIGHRHQLPLGWGRLNPDRRDHNLIRRLASCELRELETDRPAVRHSCW